jgi:succinyl-CoA synthetase beta subunit
MQSAWEKAFRIIPRDPQASTLSQPIIFGGIVRCDGVAQGIVDAYKPIGNIPGADAIIVRLQGITMRDEAKKLYR